ncbi:hypothetical protein [Bradyrhizobium sp. 6(2017)]|uniref:hypothetical protein n=1 Tax=Bradyrhizobium sp. 6(2017) TaxID=1197460 RepID=UPI0013E16B22|nr:hypothetical protein [Bradyrhizobium sp. 6(2017)]QIG92074.1 hypothetical protein G6P99_05865 [Bradyrhizobium sp. 6(2017)]
MTEEDFALLRSHRNNIYRYRRLLETQLSTLERQYLERRLSEEQTAIEMLSRSIFPLKLGAVNVSRRPSPTTA